MIIEIIFNDLVSCNPIDHTDSTSDVVVTTQGESITIPFSSFQYVNKDDGKSIAIKVQTYNLLSNNWIAYAVVGSRAVAIPIRASLVHCIKRII